MSPFDWIHARRRMRSGRQPMHVRMQEFIGGQAAGGIVLLGAALLALVLANSRLEPAYRALLHVPISLTIGQYGLELSVEHWINDGLMALFFLLVGLEIKRELVVGELAHRRAAILPVLAAAGGALVPAILYLALNAGTAGAAGWGIPMATDIAFTLGCLVLLGTRVPFGLKVFVTAVAIVDDLIAVLVIALFYSGALDRQALAVAALLVAGIWLAGRFGVRNPWFYVLAGVPVWFAVLQSGVHASIAGVLVAAAVPALPPRRRAMASGMVAEDDDSTDTPVGAANLPPAPEQHSAGKPDASALELLEHRLQKPVDDFVMPVFALANAGVVLSMDALGGAGAWVAAGIVLGLVIGKPLGLVGTSRVAVRLGIARLPEGVGWRHQSGAGVLCGIGFTMSLFIADLAFPDQPTLLDAAKIGILAASVIAGVAGTALLARAPAEPAGD